MALDTRMYLPVNYEVAIPLEGNETAADLGSFDSEMVIKDAVVTAVDSGVTTGEVTIAFSNGDSLTASGIVSGTPTPMTGITYTDAGVTATVTATNLPSRYIVTMTYCSITKEDRRFNFKP